MNETRAVARSKDIRDSGSRLACCCICGKGLAAKTTGPIQWWCGECHRQYALTTYAVAPEWVRFLVQDEEKRRREFNRDDKLVSWDALAEAEDVDEDAEVARENDDFGALAAEEDPAIAEAEMRIDGELWMKKQSPADVHLLHLLQDGNTQAEAAEELKVTQKTVSLSVTRLKASLRRFLEV